jgi:hypothetical protein
MIHVLRSKQPWGFVKKCKTPGKKWLKANPGATRPRDYWSQFLPKLQEGFRSLCAYSAMHCPSGTVDHYLSCSNYPNKAYEWDNYRFASSNLNQIKLTADDAILDPYQVQDGWFEILLPSLQLVATNQIPKHLQAKAAYTLKRLRLGNDERIIRWRRSWYELYQKGQLTIDGLELRAPLIASAVRKQLVQQANTATKSRAAKKK